MNDRYATQPTTRRTPNPHDVAKAVFRPDVYTELHDWLRETNPGLAEHDAGFRTALDGIKERALTAAAAPSARLLDHATAAYFRQAADSLDNAGHYGAGTLLRHVADDYDGGLDAVSTLSF